MKYPRLDFVPKPKKYKTCPYCGQDGEHYWHHVFNGSLKKKSETYGAVIYPCDSCHTGDTDSIHKQQSQEKMKDLKRHYQLAIMLNEGWNLDDWRTNFTDKSYL